MNNGEVATQSPGDASLAMSRLVDERRSLCDRITKLNAFVGGPTFGYLPLREQDLLRRQLSTMRQYDDILVERVEYWRERAQIRGEAPPDAPAAA